MCVGGGGVCVSGGGGACVEEVCVWMEEVCVWVEEVCVWVEGEVRVWRRTVSILQTSPFINVSTHSTCI